MLTIFLAIGIIIRDVGLAILSIIAIPLTKLHKTDKINIKSLNIIMLSLTVPGSPCQCAFEEQQYERKEKITEALARLFSLCALEA